IHTLVPNEHEAALLAGPSRQNPREAALRLRKMGCRQVVITLGARGVLLADEAGIRTIAAPRVRPVDTVGAGDCFTAWLGLGLAEGLSLDDAAARAVRAAALAVTRPGAQAGMPHRREI
ncbi:MAG: PfkB family carbohydrate kinase, partial [Verrucomicrobiota bacterium]